MINGITVLMPTFNAGKFLRSSMKSILNQTYKNFEFIIINDGSTDDSREIVDEFNDSRIRYIYRKHYGFADTLNYGLSVASYEWVARMDADDISMPKRLQIQADYLSNKDKNYMASSWYILFKGDKTNGLIKTPVNNSEIQSTLALHNVICHPAVIYNRKIILDNGGYSNIPPVEDYDLWLRIRNDVVLYNIPEPLILTRLNSKSLTRVNVDNTNRSVYKIQERYYQELDKNFPFLGKSGCYIRGWREFFYGDRNKARYFWNHIILKRFYNLRLVTAYFLTFAPDNFVKRFKGRNLRAIFEYYFYCRSEVRKIISSILKSYRK
jgi:glycosyltransferase involved in cell wall biosynthesis